MTEQLITERRRDQIEASTKALKRAFPQLPRETARSMSILVIEASDGIPNPHKAQVVSIARAAFEYVQTVEQVGDSHTQAGIARRNLQEVVRGRPSADVAITWDLRNPLGENVGTFTGSRESYERLQSELLTPSDKSKEESWLLPQ